MKRLFKFDRKLKMAFLMLIAVLNCKAQLPNTDPLYDTVFVEEFNGSTLNQTKWATQFTYGHFTNTNTWPLAPDTSCSHITTQRDMNSIAMNPLDTHNRKITGGNLELITYKENHTAEVWTYPPNCNSPECVGTYLCFDTANPTTSACFKPIFIPFKYSGAMVRSKKRFKYGYYESSFMIPTITGGNSANYSYSPNFWMLGADSSSAYSEIDIFEINAASGDYHSSIHVKRNASDTVRSDIGGYDPAWDVTTNVWHTGSVKWIPDTLYFYYDGSLVRTISDSVSALTAMNLIIDNFSPAINFCIPIDSVNTPYPYNYKTGYIKVWQPKLACDTDKVYCNVTQATFNSKYYKSLTIGGSGCSATFNNGKHSAIGNDYVLLNEGFEVGTNMEMLIDVRPCPSEKPYAGLKTENPSPPSTQFYNDMLQSKTKTE